MINTARDRTNEDGADSRRPGPPIGTARTARKRSRAIGPLASSITVAVVMSAGVWGVLSAGEGVDSGYFTLVVTPPTARICASDDAIYLVDTDSVQGFNDPVTLSTMGTPAGTTSGFSVNPVTPPDDSLLTIGNTFGLGAALYQFEVAGIAPTSTITTAVYLEVISDPPGMVDPVLPADGATDQLQAPRIEWTGTADADEYELQIATNAGFTNIVYSATTEATVHTPSSILGAMTTHFWRVHGANACGPGVYSATRTFTTGFAEGLLLVDDDNEAPDVRDSYATALTGLGIPFDVYDTNNSDGEPSRALLDLYPAVVWFSGASFTSPAGIGTAGPGPDGEAALADYLTGGGCLFISSQDYLWDHGLTPFGTDYLGVGSFTSDIAQTTVVGQGAVFGGLGPYALVFPFSNFSDEVIPALNAELAFAGDVADAGVTRSGTGYRTVFLGFPLEAIPANGDRQDVLWAALEPCIPFFADGFETGDLSRWSTSVP